jgi:thiol-disulfide isomerase/thioredoxin
VKNGQFVFRIKPDSSFYPYLASLNFPDSNSATGSGILMFINNKSNGFFIEPGVILISADTTKLSRTPAGGLEVSANVNGGKQNKVFSDNQMTDFGWLGHLDSITRKSRIRFFRDRITKYRFSYYLLDGIVNARNQYASTELTELLELFDANVQESIPGKKLRRYLENRHDPNFPCPNLSLLTTENKRKNIIDAGAKLNMLVFWASWCGPCRAEIPALKRLYDRNKNERFNLVSISVDEQEENWRKALEKEKMLWPQFWAVKDQRELIDAQFDPSTIPMIIFTDSTGYEIAKFVGYEPGQEQQYDSIIVRYFKNK